MKKKYTFGSMNFKNNLISVNGPRHEQGGVSLNKDVEVEGGESIFDNFVFSDRLPYPKSKMSFSDKAKMIEKRYGKDTSPEAIKSKEREMRQLAELQEEMKSDLVVNKAPGPENGKQKMFIGGAIAGAAGGLVNVGRGLFEKPRQYDKLNFERADYKDAEFGTVDFDNVDYSEQRSQAAVDTRRNRLAGNATIRNNASSAGQLLANTIVNNTRSLDTLNRVNRNSFQDEENTNVNINNSENQLNTQIKNSEEQFNVGNFLRTNMFNAQVGNQELMQNFDIQLMNDANKDAKRQMIYDGIGQMLGSAGSISNGLAQQKGDKAAAEAGGIDPALLLSLFGG